MAKTFPARGFTLIELLVAISLTIIISSFGLAYYSSFNRRQIVEQTAKKIVSDIRLAQSLALSQQKPPPGCTCTNLISYTFTISGTGYTITPDCSLPTTCHDAVKNVTLGGITLSGTDSIKFMVLTQGVVIAGGSTMTVRKDSYSRTILIGDGGDLKIQ